MDYFLSNYQVKDILDTPPEQFDYDLIIVDLFYTEALLSLGYYFRTPVVGIVSSDFANYMERVQEIVVPSACLPYNLENYDTSIGFWQRLDNIKQCRRRRDAFISEHYAKQEQVIRKYLPQLQGKEISS